MNGHLVALGTVAGWLAFVVLVVGGIAVGVSWAVVKLAERAVGRGGRR